MREFDEARKHLEIAVEAAPGEPDYAKSLADLLVERFSEFDLARQQLDRLVGDSPTDPRVYLTRGRWLLERASTIADAGRAGELATAAWDDAQRGSRLAAGDPELAVLSADAAIAQGTPLQAKETVLEALAADPKQPELYVALAQIELNSENPDGAIESFKKGLREIPGNPDLLWSLSLLELESGDYDAVSALLEQLRALEYSKAAIRLLEARLLIADGKAREAADLLEKSRSLFDRSEPLLNQADYQLAVCYRMLGNPDQELAALRRVLGMDPLSVRAREDLARALLKAGRRQEALAEYAQIVRQPNRSIGAIVNYAQLLFLDGLGKGNKGQDWAPLRSVLELLDSMPEAADYVTVLRSDLLAVEGEPQAAEELLRDQIKRDPEVNDRAAILDRVIGQKPPMGAGRTNLTGGRTRGRRFAHVATGEGPLSGPALRREGERAGATGFAFATRPGLDHGAADRACRRFCHAVPGVGRLSGQRKVCAVDRGGNDDPTQLGFVFATVRPGDPQRKCGGHERGVGSRP